MPNSTEALPWLIRREWQSFRSRGRMVATAAACLLIVVLGLLVGFGLRPSCSEGPVEVACPSDPAGPDGEVVSDQFFFVHRDLGEQGSITVRLTAMTGIVTYPPPDHDEIVEGLVPWAKAGILVKDGTTQGSPYAALLLTGSHGVRMQHSYTYDTAGRADGASVGSPRWLRLTRDGDTVTGEESTEGTRWTEVGTARLPAFPATVQVGLFATSPGDLTLRRVGLGGTFAESRFTQATGVFDSVTVDGSPAGAWHAEAVGEMNGSDWERYHRPSGLVESNGTYTVSGTGDIGPVGEQGAPPMERVLVGLVPAAIMLIVVAARFMTSAYRPGPTGATAPPTGRVVAAKAVVVGAVTFVAGLVAIAVTVPVGARVLRGTGDIGTSVPTQVRVVVGAAALLAVVAVLALVLGALVRRTWVAVVVALSTVVLPYLVAVLPLLPDEVARWLLRVTPAAGFAVLQSTRQYPQVVHHYAPSAGYFPLAWWAGFVVLCGWTAVAAGAVALRAHPRRGAEVRPSSGTGRLADRS